MVVFELQYIVVFLIKVDLKKVILGTESPPGVEAVKKMHHGRAK